MIETFVPLMRNILADCQIPDPWQVSRWRLSRYPDNLDYDAAAQIGITQPIAGQSQPGVRPVQ